MHARMYMIQPVVCAIAVVALAFHAWFWVACAVQTTHQATGSSTADLSILICTPQGLQPTVLPDGTTKAPSTETCPDCSQMCGGGLAAPSAQSLHPTTVAELVLAERLAAEPARPSFILARSRPRAPPVSGIDIT
ncbi:MULTISPECIES: DUF2946 family protein [unclassified Minwuia]|jgi:hypothetical protein|uniref:DUF2946 family protein n=1 Tax=unclassified Minwuia TaxID=2618799 RepID=UPI00247AC3F5|nr:MULTISPECIES: DUF2946 family protein [unclassified Minwuia]